MQQKESHLEMHPELNKVPVIVLEPSDTIVVDGKSTILEV